MDAIIKEVKKYPTQPTNRETYWVLQFLSQSSKSTDSLMGWIGSNDTTHHIKLEFKTCKKAQEYAKKKDYSYLVAPLSFDCQIKQSKKSYLDIYRKNK